MTTWISLHAAMQKSGLTFQIALKAKYLFHEQSVKKSCPGIGTPALAAMIKVLAAIGRLHGTQDQIAQMWFKTKIEDIPAFLAHERLTCQRLLQKTLTRTEIKGFRTSVRDLRDVRIVNELEQLRRERTEWRKLFKLLTSKAA